MSRVIEMEVTRCSNNGWIKDGTQKFKRVSRWITVKQNYNPNKRNALYYYAQDGYGYKTSDEKFDPENNGGVFLDYFTFNGRNYAIEQFLALGNPFWNPVAYSFIDDDDKLHFLGGVDMENYYNPIYVEFSEYCEQVRVYEAI